MNKNSRYVSGGTSETSSTAIEWWERATFTTDPTDTVYVVEPKFEGRLDLIVAMHLGEKYITRWWVVAMINNILDPFTEVFTGRVLYLPSIERMNTIIGGQLGGVPSTREVPISILPIV